MKKNKINFLKIFILPIFTFILLIGLLPIKENINNVNQKDTPFQQTLPVGVNYNITYYFTNNNDTINPTVLISGLNSQNSNGHNRQFRLRVESTNNGGNVVKTDIISSFTTPTTGDTYTNTSSFTLNFNWNAFTYKLILEVLDNGNWFSVYTTSVPNPSTQVTPSVTSQNYTIVNTQDSLQTGSISFYYTVNNPSPQNFSIFINIVQTNCTGCLNTTIIFDENNTTGFVQLGSLAAGNYTATFVVNNITRVNTSNINFIITTIAQAPPTGTFNNLVVVNATQPGGNGTITATATLQTDPTNNAIAQFSINNGTTWFNTTPSGYTFTVPSGTINSPLSYTVIARFSYQYLTYTRYANLGSQTVNVGSQPWAAPTGSLNLQTVNTSNPGTTDGKISGLISILTNNNNNIIGKQISIDNGTTWFDVATGITGLANGSYTVIGRISWTNGEDGTTYYSMIPSTIVTIGSNNFNAPVGTFNVSQTYAPTPLSQATITPSITVTSIQNPALMDVIAEVSYGSATAPGSTWIDVTTSNANAIQTFPIGTNVYVWGRISYYADGISSDPRTYISLGMEQVLTTNNPWNTPQFFLNAQAVLLNPVTGSGEINYNVTKIFGDLQALVSMTISIYDTSTGLIVPGNTITIASTDFTNQSYSGVFNTNLNSGGPGSSKGYTIAFTGVYNLQAPGYSNTALIPISLNLYLSEFASATVMFVNSVVTNETAMGANDGTNTITLDIVDVNMVIVNDQLTMSLLIYDPILGWIPANLPSYVFTINDSGNSILLLDNIPQGTYRTRTVFQEQLGDLDSTIETISRDSALSFTVGRDWLYPITVNEQDAVVSAPIQTPTGYDRYKIGYILDISNPDNRNYSVTVQLWNMPNGGVMLDSIVFTTGMSTTIQYFTDVPAGDYTLKFVVSGDPITGLNTTPIDVNIADTTILPTLIIQDNYEWKSVFNGGDVGNIQYEFNVSNPQNKFYSFDLIVWDITNNLQRYKTTITSMQSYYRFCVFDLPFGEYEIMIQNYSGVLITGIDLNNIFITLDENLTDVVPSWLLPQNENSISNVILYSVLGALIGLTLIGFYIWYRKKHNIKLN